MCLCWFWLYTNIYVTLPSSHYINNNPCVENIRRTYSCIETTKKGYHVNVSVRIASVFMVGIVCSFRYWGTFRMKLMETQMWKNDLDGWWGWMTESYAITSLQDVHVFCFYIWHGFEIGWEWNGNGIIKGFTRMRKTERIIPIRGHRKYAELLWWSHRMNANITPYTSTWQITIGVYPFHLMSILFDPHHPPTDIHKHYTRK